MADFNPATEDRKPTVRIMTCHADDRELLPVLWGLEEEGIPAEVQQVTTGDAVSLAKQAAHMSALNVGIALNGVEGLIVLHHRELAGECPLFTLETKGLKPVELRVLGTNAARLVKGEPLVFHDDLQADGEVGNSQDRAQPYSDEIVDLIVRTVLQLLAEG